MYHTAIDGGKEAALSGLLAHGGCKGTYTSTKGIQVGGVTTELLDAIAQDSIPGALQPIIPGLLYSWLAKLGQQQVLLKQFPYSEWSL